jgi:hypothetical protein
MPLPPPWPRPTPLGTAPPSMESSSGVTWPRSSSLRPLARTPITLPTPSAETSRAFVTSYPGKLQHPLGPSARHSSRSQPALPAPSPIPSIAGWPMHVHVSPDAPKQLGNAAPGLILSPSNFLVLILLYWTGQRG